MRKPNSRGSAKFVWIGLGVVIVGLVIAVVSHRVHLTPAEEKLLGCWMTTNATLGEVQYDFYSDGNFLISEHPSGIPNHIGRWRARDAEFQTSPHSGRLSAFWDDLTGHDFEESFQIKFHGDDKFELYLSAPSGEMVFQRASESGNER